MEPLGRYPGWMCGRYTLLGTTRHLVETFDLVPPAFELEPRTNIAPGQPVLVVRPEGSARVADVAHWGLVPSWVKDPNAFSRPINARSETVAEKPSFRGAFHRKRCLIPASGFYEWRAEGTQKQPYYIHPTGHPLMAFAGLMEDWQGPGGEVMISACILTTTPNAIMAPIHDRMPVILPPAAWTLWLDPGAQGRELQGLLRPCPDHALTAHPVGPAVGNPRNQGLDLMVPLQGLGQL